MGFPGMDFKVQSAAALAQGFGFNASETLKQTLISQASEVNSSSIKGLL